MKPESYNQWLTQTTVRLRQGLRPLLPGQRFEGDTVPVSYSLSPEQCRAWQDSVIAAIRSVKPALTPDEWLGQQQDKQGTADPVAALTEFRNQQSLNAR